MPAFKSLLLTSLAVTFLQFSDIFVQEFIGDSVVFCLEF